jgi:hypothetical protein
MFERIPQDKEALRAELAVKMAEWEARHQVTVLPPCRESRYIYAVRLDGDAVAEADVLLKAPRWYPGIEEMVKKRQTAVADAIAAQKAAGKAAYAQARKQGLSEYEANQARKAAQRKTKLDYKDALQRDNNSLYNRTGKL